MRRLLGGRPAPAAAPRPRRPRHSDVVFMYESGRATYRDYRATMVAWGGTPTRASLRAARGVAFFASVGMATEFASYLDRFPRTYETGLCRDIRGEPVRIPWLTDHRHRGVPYWWCCTQQPQFRRFIEDRVIGALRAGAEGIHLDDHLGSAGALSLGACFCDRCVEGFRGHLASSPEGGAAAAGTFDVRDAMRTWLGATDVGKSRRLQEHPLWPAWTAYQCRAAAAFVQHLRALASRTAGREVPMAANAGLLRANHLADYEALDFFSAEIDHRARDRRPSDVPVFAYRLADAVGRPLAATASGEDWAFIAEADLPGLVQGWIALAYAAGHCLMSPHRQWCHTPEKGTHWYEGPRERLAPLYRFVRAHAEALDGYEAHADVVVVLPHRSFLYGPERWLDIGAALSRANVPWRLALGGDDVVAHPLAPSDFEGAKVILNPEPAALEAADRGRVEEAARRVPCVPTLADACSAVTPAVRLERAAPLRILPRVRPGSAVIHLVNWSYGSARDRVEPLRDVSLVVDLRALGVPGARTARILQPGRPVSQVEVDEGRVRLPELGLWALLVLGGSSYTVVATR